ncbi:uncharacterized protein LOC143200002 [Rhynchophorus ferrugineus]|uniref:Coiled-coil domain-containing protein n=1 Tax=Rhynchophorus ferrugineus TaxID=354439 RepID=A0A834INX6_RHYFE|nr:hypothetical protein GWI33_002998 [Rhynchophorus ferrugineus]
MIEHKQHTNEREWNIVSEYKEQETSKIIRKYINSAIYVEKTVHELPPNRKTSPLSSSDEEMSGRNTVRPKTTQNVERKDSIDSAVGYNKTENVKEKTSESGYSTNQSLNCLEGSQSTVKPGVQQCDLKLSLTCLTTDRTDRFPLLNSKDKDEIVQSWMRKKEHELKQKEMREAKIAKQRETERQKLIEKERENFKKWLAAKKKEEAQKKMEKQLQEEDERAKEIERQKRKEANEISFKLWLRRKKKNDLEKKIREKLALLHLYEEQQRKIDENERAYQEWLKNSQHRQKPIAMNKGLESLCSSTSVTYINPIPWSPNIDM